MLRCEIYVAEDNSMRAQGQQGVDNQQRGFCEPQAAVAKHDVLQEAARARDEVRVSAHHPLVPHVKWRLNVCYNNIKNRF